MAALGETIRAVGPRNEPYPGAGRGHADAEKARTAYTSEAEPLPHVADATTPPQNESKVCDPTEASQSQLALTVISAIRPKVLSKRFSLRADGTLDKRSGGQLEEGRAQRVELDGPVSFAALLVGLGPHQALMHGVFPHDEVIVVSKKRLEQTRRQKRDRPVVARNKECTSWAAAPGIMMIDYDPTEGETPLTTAELLEILYKAFPELRNAPLVCCPSASSCIFSESDGSELRGVRGQRVYVLLKDARDIERAALVLQARLWMLGHGRYVVSKSGSLLERTIIDGSVFQPSRLDFAGGAETGPGLVQRFPKPKVFNPDAPYLDTAVALPNLTGEEHRRVDEIKKAARQAKAVEAKAAREAWIADRVKEFSEKLLEPDEKKREARIAAHEAGCRAAIEDGRLFGDFVITLDDGTKVTIGEIIDNRNKYHGRKTLDPIEPDYDGGRVVGWINCRAGGRPYINSFAHGGRRYQLIRARKTIRLMIGERADVTAKTLELIRLDGALYERGGLLSRVIGSRIVPVTQEWLLLHLDRTVRFEFLRKAKDGEFVAVPEDAPIWLAQRIVKAEGEWGLPSLRAVVDAPTMDPKTGRIIAEDGFDEASGLYTQLTSNFEPIREDVGEVEAREAAKLLWLPFEKFPFADAAEDETNGRVSRSVFLAALLTTVVRRLLDTAPGILISATAPGSGKTLLALCLAALASADMPDVLGVPEGVGETELSKVLLAKALSGAPTLLLDNVAGRLSSASLCAFLTSSVYEGRVLGFSRIASVPTNSLLVLTGNKPSVVGDLNRRLLRCELDPKIETPHKRAYKLDPLDHCREHRLELVRAALIVLKAWHNAGRLKFTRDRTASFETWSDTVRQCVIWVGRQGWLDVDDPAASIDAGFEADPDTRKLDALLRAWEGLFGPARQPIKALRRYAGDVDEDIFEALDEIGVIERGEMNPRRLARWIEQRAGRIVNGRRFVQDGTRSHAVLWRVEAMGQSYRHSESGEFGEFSEFPSNHRKNENSEFENNYGVKKTHETHQTHQTPPWRREPGDAQ